MIGRILTFWVWARGAPLRASQLDKPADRSTVETLERAIIPLNDPELLQARIDGDRDRFAARAVAILDSLLDEIGYTGDRSGARADMAAQLVEASFNPLAEMDYRELRAMVGLKAEFDKVPIDPATLAEAAREARAAGCDSPSDPILLDAAESLASSTQSHDDLTFRMLVRDQNNNAASSPPELDSDRPEESA